MAKRAWVGKSEGWTVAVPDRRPFSASSGSAWLGAAPEGALVPSVSDPTGASGAVRRARVAAVSLSRVSSQALRASSNRSQSAMSSSTRRWAVALRSGTGTSEIRPIVSVTLAVPVIRATSNSSLKTERYSKRKRGENSSGSWGKTATKIVPRANFPAW